MTRKPLPKVIAHTSEELRGITAGADTDDEEVDARESASSRGTDEPKTAPAETKPRAPLAAASDESEAWARWRRSEARKIVNRFRIYAAVGGVLPWPIVNVASVTALLMRMVKALSDLYEVRDVSAATLPQDFARNPRIHSCFELRLRG
jgi:hypothetical protein